MTTPASQPPGTRRVEVACLVFCWVFFTLVLAGIIATAVSTRDWRLALHTMTLLGLWAALTALIVQRLRPRSRLALLLADPRHERLARPEPHGWLILLAVVVGAAALVLLCLRLGWTA